MIAGTLALGGQQVPVPLPLPEGELRISGDIGTRTRGLWTIVSDLEVRAISIPARNKKVQLLANRFDLEARIAKLDSLDGDNYRAKLRQLLPQVDSEFQAVVINHDLSADSSYSSFGIITGPELYMWGLVDQHLEQAYLLWSSDVNALMLATSTAPMRYLVYRFPVIEHDCLFIPIGTLCARWWRWNKNGSSLRAFNALEQRLIGPLTC